MTSDGYTVAVIGATSILGREVRSVLHERRFPVGTWRLSASDDRFADEDAEAPLEEIGQTSLGGVDLVFLCSNEPRAIEVAREAVASNSIVVDLVQAFSDQPEVPVIVPEVNADAVAAYVNRRFLTSPVSGAVALSIVLKPLDRAAQLKRIVVSSYEAAASSGWRGVEELAEQTRGLMGGESVEPAVFPQRMAFNLIPRVGELLAPGKAWGEWHVESQTRRLLELPDLPISVTSVRVPTFHGIGYTVNVETEAALDAAAAREVLRDAPGIVLSEDGSSSPYPTLTDALQIDATCVGRVRDDPTVPYGLNLWVTIDGSRKGGAVNAVQIAELVIRDYL
jgi:aspartate-semialdehyde dehydrogenase